MYCSHTGDCGSGAAFVSVFLKLQPQESSPVQGEAAHRREIISPWFLGQEDQWMRKSQRLERQY